MEKLTLETIEVAGSPTAMGTAVGEAFRERIQRFVEMRFAAVDGYCQDRGRAGAQGLLEVGERSAAIFAQWDPEGYAEHLGIAAGANVEALRLYTATNMTDMRDALLLSASSGAPLQKRPEEGCSSLLVPGVRTESGHALAGQTWDLNPPDVDYIVAIRRRPDAGPQTWSVTCTGCLSLMGINDAGLALGTTNIKVYGSQPGVGYLDILHRMLRTGSVQEASACLQEAPISGAHTYWLADPHRQREWEASPNGKFSRDPESEPMARTNHCLRPEHHEIRGEEPSPSSLARLNRIHGMLESGDVGVDRVKAVFGDRSDGVDSVNRYAEDDQGTATNAVFIAEPASRRAWACRGPADRGAWIELDFSS